MYVVFRMFSVMMLLYMVLKFHAFLVKFFQVMRVFLLFMSIVFLGYSVSIVIVVNILQISGKSMSFWGSIACGCWIRVVYVMYPVLILMSVNMIMMLFIKLSFSLVLAIVCVMLYCGFFRKEKYRSRVE